MKALVGAFNQEKALVGAFSVIVQLVVEPMDRFTALIRNYVLNYLWSQPKLAQFVVQGLVTLFSRITKLGWFDSDKEEFVFRAVITDVTKFLQGSAEHCMVGVQLLSQLVCEVTCLLC